MPIKAMVTMVPTAAVDPSKKLSDIAEIWCFKNNQCFDSIGYSGKKKDPTGSFSRFGGSLISAAQEAQQRQEEVDKSEIQLKTSK